MMRDRRSVSASVSGEVIEGNTDLEGKPELVNEDAEGAGVTLQSICQESFGGPIATIVQRL